MIQAVEEPELAVAFFADGRAQAIEEGIAAGEPVQRALVAQVAVVHDRLRAVLVDDVRPALLDLEKRLVVGDALELAAALGPDALHGVKQAVGVVVMLGVVLELHAQATTRHGMVRIAGDLHQLAVLDVVQKGAGIGTVLEAPDNTGFAGVDGHRSSPSDDESVRPLNARRFAEVDTRPESLQADFYAG